MRRELATTCAEETAGLGRRLGATAPAGGVAGLWGPLGAGKTVLAQGMLAGMGVPGPHPSPSFVLVRRYPRPGGGWVAHVDAYRLQLGSGDRLEDVGWDDLFEEGNLVIVEWAERVAGALPADRLEVRIRREGRVRDPGSGEGGDRGSGGNPGEGWGPGRAPDAEGRERGARGAGGFGGGKDVEGAGDAGGRAETGDARGGRPRAGAEGATVAAGRRANTADEARNIELASRGPVADAWLRAVLP